MAVRTRYRTLALSVAIYAACASASSYFIWHAINGQRGLKARAEYVQRLGELESEYEALAQEKKRWRLKIALIKGETIDRDLLEEEARRKLGRLHRNEVMTILPSVSKSE